MKRKNIQNIAFSAIVAALYIIFTYISSLIGLDKGIIQLRLSEAFIVFAAFSPYSILGLTIGCALSGILTGALFLDIIFGSLATLFGTILLWFFRKHPIIMTLPNVFINSITVALIIRYVYCLEATFLYISLCVFIGEFITSTVLGHLLYKVLIKYRIYIKL